ncbi:glycerate kinase, partial [Lactococcus lactis]
RTIDMSDFDPRVEEIEILIATDVTNPLTGNNGASYVFGPQKGATEEMVKVLVTSVAINISISSTLGSKSLISIVL